MHSSRHALITVTVKYELDSLFIIMSLTEIPLTFKLTSTLYQYFLNSV